MGVSRQAEMMQDADVQAPAATLAPGAPPSVNRGVVRRVCRKL
jgi:hypothetical protein